MCWARDTTLYFIDFDVVAGGRGRGGGGKEERYGEKKRIDDEFYEFPTHSHRANFLITFFFFWFVPSLWHEGWFYSFCVFLF